MNSLSLFIFFLQIQAKYYYYFKDICSTLQPTTAREVRRFDNVRRRVKMRSAGAGQRVMREGPK